MGPLKLTLPACLTDGWDSAWRGEGEGDGWGWQTAEERQYVSTDILVWGGIQEDFGGAALGFFFSIQGKLVVQSEEKMGDEI